MQTIATYPACTVVDLEQEVITIAASDCFNGSTGAAQGARFCIAQESRSHGTLHVEQSPNCIDYYCADLYQGEALAELITKAEARGDERYWFNECGSMITDTPRPHYTMALIKEGQLVEMAGQRLQVRIVHGRIRLDKVAA